MSNSNNLKKTLLATLVPVVALPAHSSVVRTDIDYQIFRDLAENKGKFTVGATGIDIANKDGVTLGTVFDDAPVINFDSIDRIKGATTLIDPQYAVTVAHNDGNKDYHWHMQFGGQGHHTDAHHYNYSFVDKNNYQDNPQATTGDVAGLDSDYQVPRLNKLVTEVVPTAVSTPATVNGRFDEEEFTTDKKYSAFIRVGSGSQYLRTPDGTTSNVYRAYRYLIGGEPLTITHVDSKGALVSGGYRVRDDNGQLIDHVYRDILSNYNAAGDSGSPIWGYNKETQRWELIAVHQAGSADKNNLDGGSNALVIRPNYHKNIIEQDKIPDIYV